MTEPIMGMCDPSKFNIDPIQYTFEQLNKVLNVIYSGISLPLYQPGGFCDVSLLLDWRNNPFHIPENTEINNLHQSNLCVMHLCLLYILNGI